jgi:hypothetical protein
MAEKKKKRRTMLSSLRKTRVLGRVVWVKKKAKKKKD